MRIYQKEVVICGECPHYEIKKCKLSKKETDGHEIPHWCELPKIENKPAIKDLTP